MEIWNEDNLGDETLQNPTPYLSEGSSQDRDILDSRETDDSESDFEVKIKRLLHNGQTEDSS